VRRSFHCNNTARVGRIPGRLTDWMPYKGPGDNRGDTPLRRQAGQARVTGMSTKLVERGARIRRTKWVELSCLLCGEAVATLEGGVLLKPRGPNSVRVNGARLVCGRCGGSLSPTDQGERVNFV
jgi:hypothetical protein